MYSMDLLRHGIGLRGYAERDPKIEYKREGTRMFNEMMVNIRERVTDLIFKVQIACARRRRRRACRGGRRRHGLTQTPDHQGDATGAGFASAAATGRGMQKQGERQTKPSAARPHASAATSRCPCAAEEVQTVLRQGALAAQPRPWGTCAGDLLGCHAKPRSGTGVLRPAAYNGLCMYDIPTTSNKWTSRWLPSCAPDRRRRVALEQIVHIVRGMLEIAKARPPGLGRGPAAARGLAADITWSRLIYCVTL